MADAYIGWDELEEPEASAVALPENERLATLLTERTRLETELNRLLGREPPSEDDKREQARFPMPIHTPESRMEDRRRAREEQRARAAAKRALERARLGGARGRDAARRSQAPAGASGNPARGAAAGRDAPAAGRVGGGGARATGRQEKSVHERWAEQRRAALKASLAARRAEWALFDQRSEHARELAAAVSSARRREEREVEAHLDQRAENGRRRRVTDDRGWLDA